MTVIDEQGWPEPPETPDERDTLLGFLEYGRATFAWKCSGLVAQELQARVGASSMTFDGICARHNGHADLLRESIDGRPGSRQRCDISG